jgi:hypothetical protein
VRSSCDIVARKSDFAVRGLRGHLRSTRRLGGRSELGVGASKCRHRQFELARRNLELAALCLQLTPIQIERVAKTRAGDRRARAGRDELDELAIVVSEAARRTRARVQDADQMPLVDHRHSDERHQPLDSEQRWDVTKLVHVVDDDRFPLFRDAPQKAPANGGVRAGWVVG